MKTVDEDCADDVDDVKDAPVLNSLQNNQFLSIDAAYQIIKASTPTDIEDKIKLGPRKTYTFLLKRPANNKHEFSDECGRRAGTAVNSKFIEKLDKLKTVVVSDCSLCVEKKVQNVRQ